MNRELLRGVVNWQGDYQGGLNVALQQMFPTSADEKGDELKSLTEEYHKYKREYVKHLVFNPDEENLSKSILH